MIRLDDPSAECLLRLCEARDPNAIRLITESSFDLAEVSDEVFKKLLPWLMIDSEAVLRLLMDPLAAYMHMEVCT